MSPGQPAVPMGYVHAVDASTVEMMDSVGGVENSLGMTADSGFSARAIRLNGMFRRHRRYRRDRSGPSSG
jgi:hypothetical protein